MSRILGIMSLVYAVLLSMQTAAFSQDTDRHSSNRFLMQPAKMVKRQIPDSLFLKDFLAMPAFQIPGLPGYDTLLNDIDSTMKALVRSRVGQITGSVKSLKKSFLTLDKPWKKINPVTVDRRKFSLFKNELSKQPVIRFSGGYTSYSFNYRAMLDTPFAERSLAQHNVTGSMAFTIKGVFPVTVNYWLRETNSRFFKDIHDVRVSFNSNDFKNKLINAIRERSKSLKYNVADSLVDRLALLNRKQLESLGALLNERFSEQKRRDYYEVLQIEKFSYDYALPDSTNRKNAAALKQEAKMFLQLYDSLNSIYQSLKDKVDSLEGVVRKSNENFRKYEQLLKGQFHDYASYTRWSNKFNEYKPGYADIPSKYKWLLGINSFSLGKSPLQYSELTAKNISINGLNFEYNSWYYLAVTAGVIDYRFKDFMINTYKRKPQYLYMARVGLGRLEKNFFILSAYHGRKQLYASSRNGSFDNSIHVSGLGLETRWSVNKNTYVTAEVTESFAPDYRSTPVKPKGKFDLHDKSNKGLSFKLFSHFPASGSRIEGMYKYTGANFQSFSSFQTNAAFKQWYVKLDQGFWKRQIRLSAALRSNEFTNPYIVQNYKSNTVFKSVSASFRKNKWPVLSIGYTPMSQLSIIDEQLVENRFQTFTASASHFYKLGNQRAGTSIVYNKFFNSNSDTAFIYYNSANLFLSQSIISGFFSANASFSYSKSKEYLLNILDETISLNVNKFGSVGFGFKMYNLNQSNNKFGANVSANIRIGKTDYLYLGFERGYLPGHAGQLVDNDMGSIQFTKYFK